MKHEKNKHKGNKDKDHSFWRFVKIEYEQKDRKNKKIIFLRSQIALQVGKKFYLPNKTMVRTKTNPRNIHIVEYYEGIPYGASKKIIDYYLLHLKKLQEKLIAQNKLPAPDPDGTEQKVLVERARATTIKN